MAVAAGVAVFTSGKVTASDDAAKSQQFYTTMSRTLLRTTRLSCHDETAKGGLRLDSYAGILEGGDDGKVIVPGDPDASLLIQAIRRSGDLKMPPKHPLKNADIADLVAWVKAGAVGADPTPAGVAPAGSAPTAANGQETAPAAQAASSDSKTPAAALAPATAPAAEPAHLKASDIAAGQVPGVENLNPGKPVAQPNVATAPGFVRTAALTPDADFFENKVRPILANNCYECHSDSPESNFRLDSKSGFEKGGKRGAPVVPGDPDKSLLIQAIRQSGALKMPKGGHLKADEIATLEQWVKMGAKWPSTPAAAITSATAKSGTITDKQRAFWSFQPFKTVTPPAIEDAHYSHWARTPTDHFILDGLHKGGLKPAAEADRRTLIRRATFDLTGLPPTQEDVAAFVNDKSANAWEKVVDRLLASPRYGERWGRHWLDVARYAEDDVRGLDPKGRGYMPFPGAYLYRDWVIKAFNNDLPYDKFVTMQLAGDKLPTKTQAEREENLVATTYLGRRAVGVGSGRAGTGPRRRAQRASGCGDARAAGPHRGLRPVPQP